MKKKFVRLISVVLSAAMTLTAVPLSAFAEGEVQEHIHETAGNGSTVITEKLDFASKTTDESGNGWSWKADTKTLTLDNVDISCAVTISGNEQSAGETAAVYVPDKTEIVLVGESTIEQTSADKQAGYALYGEGSITFSGDGVLNIKNSAITMPLSSAIYAVDSVIVNGGTVNTESIVYAEDTVEVHNTGVLKAKATKYSPSGAAVYAKNITVDGNGTLTAVGCAIEDSSYSNAAIISTGSYMSNTGIFVKDNGNITVPAENAAERGISGSGGGGVNPYVRISGGKLSLYGTSFGLCNAVLNMSGTGSVYATGKEYAVMQVAYDESYDYMLAGSAEYGAEENTVTETELSNDTNNGSYTIGGEPVKTLVVKPDTSPRIILGKQTGIFKTEEFEIIEGMTDTKLKGTVYFDITLKNMSDEEFADARGYFGGDELDLSASIIKTDYGWVCMVCDTEFSLTYDTDNTLTIKCGDIVSNTVQVKSNANRFNKVTQGDNTNRTVFYTNTSQEEKDNYKLVSTYTVDSESVSYNWYSTNSAYSADELGAAVSGSNGEFKLADNIPAGNYVLYCDITYSDGDSTETVTEKFTFTYKECAHENGYSDGKCTNCGALCDHSDIDIDTGKCNECAHQLVATISTDGSAPIGYDTLADCLDSITADTGNYVKIYQDIGDASATAALDTIDVNHNVMIDLNGRKLNNIKLGVNKDVTLTLTGTAGSYVKQVYVRKGGSFIIDSVANVEFDTIFVEAGAGLAVNDGAKVTTASLTVKASVNDDGTTTTSVKLATGMKIGGLTYWRQDGSGLLKLGNLLDVTRQALQYDESGEYHDLYKEFVSKGLPVALTVVEHTDADHKYGSGTGRCEKCGKPCEHGGDINTDNGICSICGAVVSVALYTSADGNLSSYLDADGLDSILNEYNGSGTIKLFKDYSKPSAQYDLYGELTIDVNGRQFNIRSITPCKNGKLTIKNSGNPVMLGCNVYPTNDASYAGGTLIIDGDVVLDTSIYVYDSSTVILKDGAYTAGLYARDSKTLYDMLGEGKAFFKTDGTLFNASVKEISSSETLTVKDHSHTYTDGKCDCGYVCPHSDVDSKTGKCTECEYQYAAVIVKDGAVASVYKETEMEAAFETADSDANTGCTLKVYKNYTGSYTTLSGKFTLWIAEKANVGTLTVSGDITVTGSGKSNSIYGDFDVANGGKLTFDENCGAMGTVSVGAGTFDCYCSIGITLNINDASSDVILHGGSFRKICYNGGGDRANAEILTLLAENRMFMKYPNAEPIDGSKTLLKDGLATVFIASHEDHSYDSTTGKCTICGKRCGHTDVDSKTGVCLTCKYQLTAGVSGVGTAKYFDNIDNAFTAALSAENNGCTLTLYKDCELSQNIVIGNATVTVDMNGHSILLAYRIKVNDGGVLYLKNSRENGSIDTEIEVNKGGTLINGTADDSSSAVSLFSVYADAAKCVEIYGGSCTGLTVNNGTSGIALYGGSYELIHTNDLTDSTPVSALLAKGYAFVTLNSVTHLPESIVDGSATTLNPGLKNVTVVKHTHTYTEANTKCACGAVLYAKVTSADGTTNEYFDSIEEGLLYADKAENKGCVFTLVTSGKINSGVTLSSGQFTIATATTNNNYVLGPYAGKITIDGADVIAEGDMFIRCKVNVKSGSLTLPEGSSAGFDSIAISGGTVTVSEGVNADSYVGADNLFVSEDATDAKLTIGGGTYGNVYLGQFKLKDVIASGVRVISYDNPTDPTAEKTAKALLYSDIAEKNNFDSENGTVSYYLVTKCEHKNEDGSYAFNEGGICKYCNSEFAASVSYTDGGEKTELFGDIYDAFDKANGVGTATVTLYKDITDSERTQDVTVTGNVTIALNGKTLGGRYGIVRISVSDGGTLTVNGDGDMDTPIYVNENSKLVINGGGYFNSVSVKKGGNAEIGGGTIRGLSVRGNVKLSGGKFNDIEILNGNLESVLADGYAYKVEGGEWLSIAERAESVYSSLNNNDKPLSVEEAPIKSASIAWAGGEAPVIYRNGEKYLYVDITYELAVGSRGATYSDYVNGNNRIKDYNLYNKYMVHCYEIGKLAAKDGEVEYYIVLKCNGYEYKSNVLKLTLATCSHPKDSFSYENDGFVICGICDALIEAEVVDADGKSLGYADIESAIKLAQENEGSTVKLMSEGVSESVTVTGGRFTVDFNGKKVFYQFDVNGGDVTFTSSVKQADVETLISGITVNGTDAKVTIDGKIKLGSVTLTSGALAVNSAESYIKELSINGGKTVVNGANIDALKANGGDTVINYVTADSLSVNINGSGSISIVAGEFGSTTCKTGLGMAIASGSVVFGNSMNGITVYTYEAIQTMTKTDRIFVEKCVHKDGSGSYVLDGNPCPYCNEEIVATVSYTANGGEETDLFSDIYDAFDKANEIGTATITLYKDIENSELTRDINVTGDITLISKANNKLNNTVNVADGGKLTIRGDGIVSGVTAEAGSTVTVEENVEITNLTVSGGDVQLSGGRYTSITVNGGKIVDLLASGYAYKFLLTGLWLNIEQREQQVAEYVTVTKAPILSAELTANKTKAYRYGENNVRFSATANMASGFEVNYNNSLTFKLYIGGNLEDEYTERSDNYRNTSVDECEIWDYVGKDGKIKVYTVVKYNGYEVRTNEVEIETVTCKNSAEKVINTGNGKYMCSECGNYVYFEIAKTNGDVEYTYNIKNALERTQQDTNYKGCVIKAVCATNEVFSFADVNGADFTFDLNGCSILISSDMTITDSTVVFKDSQNGGGLSYVGGASGNISIAFKNSNVTVESGVYDLIFNIGEGCTVNLNGGEFHHIEVHDGNKTLYDLLGENKAFTIDDGELFDASKVSESDNSLTVIDHSKHVFDEYGYCTCGYQCAHDDVDTEAGVCRECNTKIYAAITVKSETETTVKYFAKLTEAFEFAAKNENNGCTLKMLRAFSDSNTDINIDGGVLTVDMNGFGVNIHSFNGSGTKITIRSDSKCTFGVENGFSMDGGTVTFSGEVSVVCRNVKLNATYFSSYVETLKIDTLILEDGVPLKQLARITNANIANINCSSEIYLYQILASGSCVDSQLYSALKANASSNFDNVRIVRCDHPDGVGRDNRCIYCNALIAASVSYTENGAEKTEYFVKEDLGKAFAKANSVASATITMLGSCTYDTDYLNVTGDVTLIANGDNAILYNTVKVADGGKLTLRGNANIFAAIAEPGSRLTAEEATRIAYLTVNGGDVKLSGGQYDNITVKDGKITDILGNGYAYKKTEGGAWLTLKEREVSEASGVTVAKAPIKSATLSTEINKLYRNSNANPTLKFNLALAHGSNLNDSYVSKRYGINSYVSGDIIYSSLSALVKDAKLSADEIIDKAGDSDVAEIYYVVTTGDGYEIKSNTVSIDLVDCDHSQVVDPTADKETAGNITTPTYCEICKSKFNAKITKGDDVRYYNDLDEAAKDAQKSENEGCTLYPLYNKNGYGGQLVITEGNFTLKYAVRTAFSRPIIINGKAKLTVTGRCAVTAFENQDAFIVRGGDVTFDGLATGSNVTINGGNVTMAANNINCLTIHGGNVSISSGGFAEIVTTVSDKVIADYIDHGFWVQDRGTKEWIDIYSLNKATASSTSGLTVRVCPMQIIQPRNNVYYTNGYYPGDIPSLQISAVPWYSGEVNADVAYQWIGIDENGYETVIEGATDRKLSLENLTTGRYYCRLTYSNATTAGVSMKSDVVTATITECEHSGGEATCTEKAKCEICGAEYGEPLGHDYVVIKVVEPDYRNEGYSVFECTRCKDSYIGNRVPVKPIPDVEEIAVEKTTYNEVDISWKNISGVDGYYVECYVGNQWKQIGFSTDGDRVAAKLSGLSAGLKYKVRIAAYAGSFTGKFRYFYIDTVPSPVWNINTVKATDETVRISWNRNTRADGYKVEWYIDNQWSAKTVTGSNNIAAVIDGLCAGTRYKVRVSAYKGDLYSPYTYGYIDTLPSKVMGITQAVTSSSFTLTWDKNESADGYTVQYYADGKWNEKTLTGNNKTTVTIGSLKGYKAYKVRIKAYKGELKSAFDDIYITTAPTKVSGLKVKSAVDSKAVVIWNADTNADGYNVGYYIGGRWLEKTITDNKTAMAELDGLTPYSTYKVRVRAYKGKLYGDYSYTTVTAVLSPVTDIKVVSAKRNSITVKWDKNASADGYKVEIYKGGKWVKKTLKGSTNATVTIDGLRAGSVYKVRIASYKGANTSAYTYANMNTAK
jgi:hypothetical protein